jgi:SsrA-binding protein
MATLAFNKRSGFDYQLLDRYEAGIVLTGQEVKSVKTGHLSLKGSFVTLRGIDLYLTNASIPPYPHAGKIKNYDPTRARKLLLKKSEIKSLIGKVRVSGLTLVPIMVYSKKRFVKLEFAVAKGKKEYDKRESIKKRDAERKIKQELKINRFIK